MKNANIGVKRTSSGLEKAWNEHSEGSRRSVSVAGDIPSTNENKSSVLGVELYADDFDDDLELDLEDPTAKGSVNYPSISMSAQSSKPGNSSATIKSSSTVKSSSALPRNSARATPHLDSASVSQNVIPREASPPPSSAPLPWSSSPPEHINAQPQADAIRRFLYSGPDTENLGDHDEQPRKRRHLPWMESQKSNQTNKNFTPLPKDKSGKEYPWNTTASAMKEMQSKHREVTKKMSKTNSAETGLLADVTKKQKGKLSKVFLSEEQRNVLDLVLEDGKSVFFTGSAGTGKSVLLREIIAALKKKHARESEKVAITASTGLAACNIGGVTLHSFAGIGLGKEPAEELVKKIKRNVKHKQRWQRVKCLIVDEVSMIDGDLFDKLERVARLLRNSGRPFGGIQLIITGDFFQLPPVPEKGAMARFAFEAATWNTVIDHTIGLTQVFRQKDPVFAGMLNEMREGRLTPSSIDAFRKLNRNLNLTQGLEATELFPLREQVDFANRKRMTQLHGEIHTYQAKDGGTITNVEQRTKMLSNCMAPMEINLKKGSQVMLIKNIDDTLVNGSLGRVLGFMNETQFDNYQENEEDFIASARDPDNDDPEARMKLEQARRAKMSAMAGSQILPLVRFSLPDGTTRDLLCQRESWKIELPNGEVQASRSQVPLILAWALSIHKAQGQTLEHVKVDLGRVFEKGQAYVALSRATTMQGLQILNFDPRKVVAHDKVRVFYANLSRASPAQDGGLVMKKSRKQPSKKTADMSAEEYERHFIDGWGNDSLDAAHG